MKQTKFTWKNNYKEFIEYLKDNSDTKVKEFNRKISVSKYEMLGLRIPFMRDIAKEIAKNDIYFFLDNVKSNYYEEVMIEGFVIGYIKEEKEFFKYFNKYIKKVDSWDLCDSCVSSLKIMKKNDYYDYSKELINNKQEFIQRVGYVILLNHYVDEKHIKDILSLCKKNSDLYYVNMAIAWLICDCFIKFRSNTLELIKERILSPFVQNKAISKINDSFRVSKEDKELLKEYRKLNI